MAGLNGFFLSVKKVCASTRLRRAGVAATEGATLGQAGDPAGQHQNSQLLHSPLKSEWPKSYPALREPVLCDSLPRGRGEQFIRKS